MQPLATQKFDPLKEWNYARNILNNKKTYGNQLCVQHQKRVG